MATAGQQQLLHVVDSASGVRYLVDSGAQVSVVPFRSTKTPHSALLAADGRKIPTWGVVTTGSDWIYHLPWVLLGLRTAPRTDSSISAAQATFGTPLLLPSQFLSLDGFGTHVNFNNNARPFFSAKHHRKSKPELMEELRKANYVFIRNDSFAIPPLDPPYQGPFVIESKEKDYFVVKIGTRLEKISLDRLKPAIVTDPEQIAAPRPRGRPKKHHHVFAIIILKVQSLDHFKQSPCY